MEKKIINEIIEELTEEIRTKQGPVLEKIGKIINQKEKFTFQQFNGRFGGKNNTYVDVVRTEFSDFDDFYSQWLNGIITQFENDMEEQRKKYNGHCYPNNDKYDNLRLLKHPDIEELVRLFLERNFYKKLIERTRHKPDENLWSIWFGEKVTYGLLIAPVKRKGEWTNDKSEIRKAGYSYWTIGHVLTEGLVDPENDDIYTFKDLDEFLKFYQKILKRLAISSYEKSFYDKYIEHLENSKNVMEEPLLIPELRYAGLNKKHEHRLDFTVLNIHSKELIGFEISPSSSHMSVSNLKDKQVKVNSELREKWDKEMKKRNDYFKQFGITTITFTDATLGDIDQCFSEVISKLKRRPKKKLKVEHQQLRLKNLKV